MADSALILTLYNAMILPVFDCWAVVWDSCSKADREYLDKLHRCAASIIEGYAVADILKFRLTYAPVPPGLYKVHASV